MHKRPFTHSDHLFIYHFVINCFLRLIYFFFLFKRPTDFRLTPFPPLCNDDLSISELPLFSGPGLFLSQNLLQLGAYGSDNTPVEIGRGLFKTFFFVSKKTLSFFNRF